jgi:hypothetical protein
MNLLIAQVVHRTKGNSNLDPGRKEVEGKKGRRGIARIFGNENVARHS